MKKRTRLFLIVATAVLCAGLGTGLVAAYMGGFQNLVIIGSDGPEELAYVPKDAGMLAYADVRAIMSSPLHQKFHQQLQKGPGDVGPNSFQSETGINFDTDVDHVLASATGGNPDAQQDRPLVLARGRFDPVRIEGLIRSHGGTVQDYKGKRLLTQSDQHIGVAFVEPDLVAVGTPEAVRRAIDTKAAGNGTIKDNAEVMRLVRDIDGGTAWAVARFDTITKSGRLPGTVASQLPPLNWFAVTGQIDDGVRGSVRAEARDEAAAKDLQEVVRGFMALARLQAGQHAEFAALINSLELSGQGSTVTLGFNIPGEMIDALSAMHADRRPGPGGAPVPPQRRRQTRPVQPGAAQAPSL